MKAGASGSLGTVSGSAKSGVAVDDSGNVALVGADSKGLGAGGGAKAYIEITVGNRKVEDQEGEGVQSNADAGPLGGSVEYAKGREGTEVVSGTLRLGAPTSAGGSVEQNATHIVNPSD